jgi:hypothetical protein
MGTAKATSALLAHNDNSLRGSCHTAKEMFKGFLEENKLYA